MDDYQKARGAAIGLGVTAAVLLVALIVVSVLAAEWKQDDCTSAPTARLGRARVNGSVGACSTAFQNCLASAPNDAGVFKTNLGVMPPPVAPSNGAFSLPAAMYAAQVVGTLEAAGATFTPPAATPGATILSVFSGINTNTDPTKPYQNKNVNIGWVLSAQGGKQLWIGFRGTQTQPELMEDFDVQQVKLMDSNGAPVLVHSGFYKAYSEVRSTVRQIINDALAADPSITLYISGHSLGAALATLCIADFTANPVPGLKDVRAYVFASPRVGNTAFVSMLVGAIGGPVLKELYYFCNDADIIPTLPLPVNPNFQDKTVPLLYDQFPQLRYTDNWGSVMKNHSMQNYVANFSKLTAPVPMFGLES